MRKTIENKVLDLIQECRDECFLRNHQDDPLLESLEIEAQLRSNNNLHQLREEELDHEIQEKQEFQLVKCIQEKVTIEAIEKIMKDSNYKHLEEAQYVYKNLVLPLLLDRCYKEI